MSQNLKLTVNSTDLTRYLVQDGWSVAQQWSRQGDTATFTLVDEHPDVPMGLSFTVGPLSSVVLADAGSGQTLFSGLVPKPALKLLGPTLAQWQLDCVDYTYLSDRRIVFGDYLNMTADQLAITLTQQANCGISAVSTAAGGFVAPGPQIPRLQVNYATLTAAWTKISKVASISASYGWYVDENRNLHFYNPAQAADSGIVLTDDIQSTVPGAAVYERDTFGYEWDATSIRNTVTVRGADYSQQQTDLFVGNGQTASFPLTFLPDVTNIATAALIVGGVTKTVSAETGASATTDWVIVGNAANQWFLQPNTDATPAASTLIQITYPFLQPVLAQIVDTTSVARFKSLPNGGAFAYYIGDTTLPTLLAAQKRGQREVWTYSQPTERVNVTVPPPFTGHVRAGQLVTVVNATVPDMDAAGNPPGINDKYLVLQNRIEGHPGLYRSYQLTAARVGQET